MGWLTLIASAIIAGPMALWMTGIAPAWMLVINFTGLMLTVRLYAVSASFADNAWSSTGVGLFSGLTGGLIGEVLLHTASRTHLAAVFSTYASLGAELYRLDVLNRWFPFAMAVFSSAFYAGLALFVHHLVRYRRNLLDLGDPKA